MTGMNGAATMSCTNCVHFIYDNRTIILKCVSYGVAIAMAAKFWDNAVGDFRRLFQEPIEDKNTKVRTPSYNRQ